MSDTPKPTSTLVISAVSMILFGLLMIAVGRVYGTAFVLALFHSHSIRLSVIIGFCGALSVGGGLWLIYSGGRVLLKLLTSRRNFDD